MNLREEPYDQVLEGKLLKNHKLSLSPFQNKDGRRSDEEKEKDERSECNMAKKSLAARRRARKKYEQAKKTSKPGGGKRFKAVEASARASGAKNPKAVAAAIGRKKYGKKKFQKMAAQGRKRKRGKK